MRQQTANRAKLTAVSGGYLFESSYDAGLVSQFKTRIPADSRRWDPVRKAWLVAPAYTQVCADLAKAYLGVVLAVPTGTGVAQTETKLYRCEYIGRCKDRGSSDVSAFGWAEGSWALIFPESVLRDWFDAEPQKPGEKPTLYAVLCIKATASTDEVRSSYRRLAKQWHPDICREEGAAEQFKLIQRAYETLVEPLTRKKYDAGLSLSASAQTQPRSLRYASADSYRPPLRCGWILGEGQVSVGRFVFSKIIQWEDITDNRGRTMISSWPLGAEHFVVGWQ